MHWIAASTAATIIMYQQYWRDHVLVYKKLRFPPPGYWRYFLIRWHRLLTSVERTNNTEPGFKKNVTDLLRYCSLVTVNSIFVFPPTNKRPQKSFWAKRVQQSHYVISIITILYITSLSTEKKVREAGRKGEKRCYGRLFVGGNVKIFYLKGVRSSQPIPAQ